MGGGLLQSLHIPDKTSGAQNLSQPPADPVGARVPGGPARVCSGYFGLAEQGSQQAHTRKGQFLPSHLGGTLGDWPPIQDCGSPAPSTAVSAQWAPWTEEALEWVSFLTPRQGSAPHKGVARGLGSSAEMYGAATCWDAVTNPTNTS